MAGDGIKFCRIIGDLPSTGRLSDLTKKDIQCSKCSDWRSIWLTLLLESFSSNSAIRVSISVERRNGETQRWRIGSPRRLPQLNWVIAEKMNGATVTPKSGHCSGD